MSVVEDILPRLEKLVACDTRNPPRAMSAGDPVFGYLQDMLTGFDIHVADHGAGSLGLLAVRGSPNLVFNFHLDTVPDTEGWSRDPFSLAVAGDRAIGLGACDIKGALACMLSAAAASGADMAILVTTDEEAGAGKAVAAFLQQDHGFSRAVVAEPTRCLAVTAHRGIATARAVFSGVPGHASAARALDDNAIHRAMEWGVRCLAQARSWRGDSSMGLDGIPLNIGRIEGGIKPNMIAAQCELRLGLRSLPGEDGRERLEVLRQLADPQALESWDILFHAPSLPAADAGGGAALATSLGLDPGPAVDFWSEAALFSAAGLDALVLGSGDIAQAHTADEWVALEQLATLQGIYRGILERGH